MFTTNQEAFLIRHLQRANVVLFLGAGFSSLATNRRSETLPAGGALAKLFWEFLDYDEAYDGSSLAEVYEAVLSTGEPHDKIKDFLESHLLCRSVPEQYRSITSPFWYRIYTTNADDLVEKVYDQVGTPGLKVLATPTDDLVERDQFLSTIQLVHLNGRLPCSPHNLTFSVRQYARASVRPQPLYEQFVRDYATHPVVFVGTTVSEPIFWNYLELREERAAGVSEQRPESFLISRRISPPKKTQLKRYNITPIEVETTEFLQWLAKIAGSMLPRLETLRLSAPGVAAMLSAPITPGEHARDREAVVASFNRVPTELPVGTDRSLFLLGAAPRWEDLFQELDAPRLLTTELVSYMEAEFASAPHIAIAAVLGPAGCGKSTILRRAGIQLARAGRQVFLTNSETLPQFSSLRRFLDGLPERSALLFDNAEIAIRAIPDLVIALKDMEKPPIIVIASRTNDFDRLWGRFGADTEIKEFSVPNLSRVEIEAIIEILEKQALLGELRGLNARERVRMFEDRAHKQILVAMREATSGRGFNLIIEDEYRRLTPSETQMLYLCTALATEAGYRLTREEFVGCSRVSPAEALHLLARNLKDVIIPGGSTDNLLMIRHRLIAEFVVEQVATRPDLREAYIRVITMLAPSVRGQRSRSRSFGLYRTIISHRTIYRRFREDIEEARSIYQSLIEDLAEDAQFWLQFGSLELEGTGGDIQYAENYLRQARSLDPGNAHIENSFAHLLIRKGVDAPTRLAAQEFRREGSELLEARLRHTSFGDAYAIHIYCSQRYRWLRMWLTEDDDAQREELESLLDTLRRGCEAHPQHRRLQGLRETIQRASLQLAIPKQSRPPHPLPPVG